MLRTLSEMRPRKINPKIAKLGDLTFLLDKRTKPAESNVKPQRKSMRPTKDSQFLDSIASRPPTDPMSTKLIKEHIQKTHAARRRTGDLTAMSPPRSPLPDPLRRLPPRDRDASQYRRPVASLDKLAAQSGVDSSTDAIRKHRSYTDRVAERAQPSTRFALPRRPAGARTSKWSKTARPG